MKPVKTIDLPSNRVLEIFHDELAESPREWDNLGVMVCFHGRVQRQRAQYKLGDRHSYQEKDFSSWEQLRERIEADHNVLVILPLYLYDHSGITIQTTPFSCPWDSGQVGWIFCTREKAKENWGNLPEDELLLRTHKLLVGETETYDLFLRGEVYYFRIKTKCPHCDRPEDDVEESCGGFYGDHFLDNGIADHLSKDDTEALRAAVA